ncbi:MAG: TPM domain-containing protein [Proteobacteria bacterium]|nr:TPM domain-containing protein [Pseudomonadota bacterium]MBU4259163.1 TPM domain-containing protein [Pseudomonadota bacterium]MBU4288426.1 TPM domain-containing protein [Pseudomonadota bacterium]MBU4415413.1 TPM domain-containing protein [Pseudomonadota bacterium]MCG2831082.1 TPM domain-containing protein [Desulfobacteraceae bacterium]
MVAGFLVFIAFALAISISLAFALEVPRYKGYVNDYADMISPQMEAKLERALQSFDLTDSTQVAVLTITSMEGDSIEEFSIRTVDQWKVGQKGKDNGVLLLVAQKDRKIRIEVGRGLEPVLTDLLSGRIIDTVLTPYFKAGRFDEGFEAGIVAIVQATRGEFKADGGTQRGRRQEEASPFLKFLFFGMILVAFLGSNSKALGIVAGGLLFPLAFLFGLLPSLGFLVLLLLIPVGALGGWLLPLFLASILMGGSSIGHYGGGMGRSFGGSSGGFGGFGGGGFGGGGASGGW